MEQMFLIKAIFISSIIVGQEVKVAVIHVVMYHHAEKTFHLPIHKG